jgi:peroxiredoxin
MTYELSRTPRGRMLAKSNLTNRSHTIIKMRKIQKEMALLFLLVTCMWGRSYGPAIGSVMPGFELQDQNGKTLTLKDVQGANGTVILFYRSADWCPFCKSQLVELEQNKTDFFMLGLGVAAISYDSVSVLHDFAERRAIHFPLLSDSGSKVIRGLEILNDSVQKENPYFGSAYPCLFVLDGKNVIVAKYFEEDHRRRNVFTDILSHQFGKTPSARRIEGEGRQLKFAATASSSIVGPGGRLTLTLDIELKPNVHVYAPSVDGYIPIEWKIEENGASATQEVHYPSFEKLYLQPIHESVPVYRGHFRLRGLITIASNEKLASLVDTSGNFPVDATLLYQACDERTCYPPERLPIKWMFHYLGFDRQGTSGKR